MTASLCVAGISAAIAGWLIVLWRRGALAQFPAWCFFGFALLMVADSAIDWATPSKRGSARAIEMGSELALGVLLAVIAVDLRRRRRRGAAG